MYTRFSSMSLVCLGLVFLLAVCTSSAIAAPTGLPAGHWYGSGNNYGSIWKQGKGHGVTSADGYGRFTINLYVFKNGKISGALGAGGGANSYVHGGHGHFSYYSDDFQASGTSTNIVFNGTVKFSGTVTIASVGKTIPMEFTFPGNSVLHFTHMDCGSATADLAVEKRNAQKSAGFQTNVKASIVLLRVGDAETKGAADKDASNWFQALDRLSADIEIDFKGRSKQQIEDEIKTGKDAMAGMGKYKECGGATPLPSYEIAAMKNLMEDDILIAELQLKTMK